ncbi:MAG: hypothetical protein R3228_13135, partial [Halioglobus sp.]|nr:hypothetical protein [Halioglobus sp.]
MTYRIPVISFSVAVVLAIPLWLDSGSAYATAESDPENGLPAVSLTRELVQDRLATLDAEGTAPELVESYQKLTELIERRAGHTQDLEYFLAAMEGADEQVAEIRARIDAIDPASAKLQAHGLALESDKGLEDLVEDLERDLAQWQDTLSTIDRRIASLSGPAKSGQARLEDIARRLAELPDAGSV